MIFGIVCTQLIIFADIIVINNKIRFEGKTKDIIQNAISFTHIRYLALTFHETVNVLTLTSVTDYDLERKAPICKTLDYQQNEITVHT